jgi:hypothetical protein
MSFLHRLVYARYVGEVYTALRDGVLARHLPGGAEKKELANEEIPRVLIEVFGADPHLYLEALAIHRRYMPELSSAPREATSERVR